MIVLNTEKLIKDANEDAKAGFARALFFGSGKSKAREIICSFIPQDELAARSGLFHLLEVAPTGEWNESNFEEILRRVRLSRAALLKLDDILTEMFQLYATKAPEVEAKQFNAVDLEEEHAA